MKNPFDVIEKKTCETTDDQIHNHLWGMNDIIYFSTENISLYIYEKMIEYKYGKPVIVDLSIETENTLNGMNDKKPFWLEELSNRRVASGREVVVVFKNLSLAQDNVQRNIKWILKNKIVNNKWPLSRSTKLIILEPNNDYYGYLNRVLDNICFFWKKPTNYDLYKLMAVIDIHPLVWSYALKFKDSNYLLSNNTNMLKSCEKLSRRLYSSSLHYDKIIVDTSLNDKDYITYESFISFAKQEVISIENILNHEYDLKEANLSESQQHLMIAYLSSVGVEDIETIRNFIMEMNPNLLQYFDILWMRDDEEKHKIIEELSKTNNNTMQKKLNM